ncbi:unnamed protein product [Closterium sp. NIES-53]
MALSPLAMAPSDLPPLTATPVPCCNMVGEGVARGGSSCPRALQSHQQHLLPRLLSLSLRTLCWERGGSLEVQGEAGGDLQHQAPPTLLLPPPVAGAAEGGRGSAAPTPPPLILLLPPPAAGAAVGGKRSAIPLLRMRQLGEGTCSTSPPPTPRPPPSPPSLCCRCRSGGKGMGVASVANLLLPERLLHRPFSYLPPAAGAAVGGRGSAAPAPPTLPPRPPFLLHFWGGRRGRGGRREPLQPHPLPCLSPPAATAVGGRWRGWGVGERGQAAV